MKCQRCHKQAVLHITEILDDEGVEELHLCTECSQKYLSDDQNPTKKSPPGSPPAEESEEARALDEKQCASCGMKFSEFRSTGRLGCPADYDNFREELTPLLESIHGASAHAGKSPRRRPHARRDERELTELRKRLEAAVFEEDYERAAQLRDRIRGLEGAG